jgi:tetratricopeptide (TPR) repeat protein
MSRRWKFGAALALLAIIAAAAYSAGRYWWADWHFRACEDSVRQGDYVQAKQHLRACATVWTSSWRCQLWKIRLARLTGQTDDAERLVLAAKLRHQEIPHEALRLENTLLQAQQGLCDGYEEQRLRNLVDADHPDAPLILHALVLGYLRLYRLNDAQDCLKVWLEAQPDNLDALLQLGKSQERLTQYNLAVETYEKILQRKPRDDELRIRVALLLVGNNQIPQAAAHVEPLLERHRDDSRVQLSAGIYRHAQGKLDEAAALLDDLLQQEPQNVRGLVARGKIALQQNDLTTAHELLERAVKAAPKDFQALFTLAQCLIQLGKDNEGAQLQAQAKRAQEDMTRITDLTKTLQSRPNDPDVRSEIGTLLVSFGETREGRLWLESALRFDPQHAAARKALAAIGESPATQTPP